MPGVGVPAGDSMPYSHSHSLDCAAEVVATAASATVSKVIRMIGIEAGLSVQNAAMKMQWRGLLPSLSPSRRHQFLVIAPASLTRPTRRPFLKGTYTSSVYNASSRSATAPQGTRFPSTIPPQSRSPPPDRWSPALTGPPRPVDATRIRARSRGPADRARDGCCRLARAAGGSLLGVPSHTDLSGPLFCDVLRELQPLSCTAGCLAPNATRDAFLTALPKAALPPRIVAALDDPPQGWQEPRSPVSLERLTTSQAAVGCSGTGSGARLSLWNLACLGALVGAAIFLAATHSPSWLQLASTVTSSRLPPPASTTLACYDADEKIRGKLPFPRYAT